MHPVRALILAIIVQGITLPSPAQQVRGTISRPGLSPVNAQAVIQGNALSSTNVPVRDGSVRLRDARRGRIVQTSRTDQTGLFVFRGVEPGTYIVELLGADQTVLAASELLNANAGDTVSAIVKLPFKIQPFAGVLGHTTMSAMLVTATAAATGVLAAQVAGEPVSPRR
jgi:hypothetical protein